ncbi:peptidase C15 [Sodalinema gerasimenkoae]|uniref:pyroglutamyl-peptidase I family protein n=1 Tax=Sodalinema gerasimenkoae TaxID=2862348 RepID=UPI001358C844|nr:peptidase C15 [Sodalinema gerasimenkoae]
MLLSSFDIWKPHHRSNSSDDLLAELQQRGRLPESARLLRRLPVDTQQASAQLLAAIHQYRPPWVLLGGMAEGRSRLTVERRAVQGPGVYCTPMPVWELVAGLDHTDVSYHAGRFVCNATYYQVLSDIATANLPTQALFLHVPCSRGNAWPEIVADADQLLQRLITRFPSPRQIVPETVNDFAAVSG